MVPFWSLFSDIGPYFFKLTALFSFLYNWYNSMIFTPLIFGPYFLRPVLISTMVPIFWIFLGKWSLLSPYFPKAWSLFGPYFLTLVPISKISTSFFSFLYNCYNSMIFTPLIFGPYFLRSVLISRMVPIFSFFSESGPYLVLIFQKTWSLFGPY